MRDAKSYKREDSQQYKKVQLAVFLKEIVERYENGSHEILSRQVCASFKNFDEKIRKNPQNSSCDKGQQNTSDDVLFPV